MPCFSQALTPDRRLTVDAALDRLKAALASGQASAVIGSNGALAFKGWDDRDGISDLCAYRALSARNSPELRKALARAEVMSGRKLDARAVAAGTHSHDGGASWHPGH